MEEDKISKDSDEGKEGGGSTTSHYAASGTPIVRSSTPRPLPFLPALKTDLPHAPSSLRADFPARAPDAPPLPEEPAHAISADLLAEQILTQMPRPEPTTAETERISKGLANEFVWLFEYALDMDPVRLNRPERLDGSAFAYGPAMLKGHRLAFEGLDARSGRVLASLCEAQERQEAEVWGILYRVPRRYTRGNAGEMPLLDKVHLAETFVPVEVQVREPYRQREITCITYIASAATRQQVSQLPGERRQPDPDYCRRLLQIARRQKLPANYLRALEALVPPTIPAASPLPATPPEPHTEPLPALSVPQDLFRQMRRERTSEQGEIGLPVPPKRSGSPFARWQIAYPPDLARWLMVFACYISVLLLSVFVLAIFQGLHFWPEVFNEKFLPLGVPWYVLLYGMLGGCVSCLISLGRPAQRYPPPFVVLAWFMRPFLGAILGSFAYLVVSSGIVQFSVPPPQHFAFCSIVGGLAGLCEGKMFFWPIPARK